MRITKLEYQKNNPNRVNLFVDGKFAVGMGANDIIKLDIYKDKEVSQDELNKIIDQSNFGKAFNAALNFLSFRPRSEWEVHQYLKRKHKSDSGAAQNDDLVIEKLKDIGQIDDEKFAAWWVEQRNAFRPKGQRAINYELARKGVKIKVKIENETELALKALKKKLPMDKDKVYRYLATRGFSYDTIESVIEKLGVKEYN